MVPRMFMRRIALYFVLALATAAQPSFAAEDGELVLKIKDAAVSFGSQPSIDGYQPYLNVRLHSETAKALKIFTTRHVGRPVDSVIDGKAQGRFIVREPVDSALIQLPFAGTLQDAKQAAGRLSSGLSTLLLRAAQ